MLLQLLEKALAAQQSLLDKRVYLLRAVLPRVVLRWESCGGFALQQHLQRHLSALQHALDHRGECAHQLFDTPEVLHLLTQWVYDAVERLVVDEFQILNLFLELAIINANPNLIIGFDIFLELLDFLSVPDQVIRLCRQLLIQRSDCFILFRMQPQGLVFLLTQ